MCGKMGEVSVGPDLTHDLNAYSSWVCVCVCEEKKGASSRKRKRSNLGTRSKHICTRFNSPSLCRIVPLRYGNCTRCNQQASGTHKYF